MMSWLCCPDEDVECEQREWSAPSSRWWFLTKNTKNDLKTKIWQCLVLSLADLGIQTRVELISFSSSWLKFSHLNHWTLTGKIIILNQKLFFFFFLKMTKCLFVGVNLIWFSDSLLTRICLNMLADLGAAVRETSLNITKTDSTTQLQTLTTFQFLVDSAGLQSSISINWQTKFL